MYMFFAILLGILAVALIAFTHGRRPTPELRKFFSSRESFLYWCGLIFLVWGTGSLASYVGGSGSSLVTYLLWVTGYMLLLGVGFVLGKVLERRGLTLQKLREPASQRSRPDSST